MRRSNAEYKEITKVIIDIYLDYDIKGFPVDENEVCRKLGVALVPYSENDDKRELLLKRSEMGIYFPRSKETGPMIYYNDNIASKGAIRFTIFHEIKHYVFNDKDDKKDDLADFFAKYFMCPIPYLLLKGIHSPNDIVSYCGVSMEAARYVSENIIRRKSKYGFRIFEEERELLEHLDPVLLEL